MAIFAALVLSDSILGLSEDAITKDVKYLCEMCELSEDEFIALAVETCVWSRMTSSKDIHPVLFWNICGKRDFPMSKDIVDTIQHTVDHSIEFAEEESVKK